MRICFALLLGISLISKIVYAENIKLPPPIAQGGKPLLDTIRERRSIRQFDSQVPDNQTLSDILFVAFGISGDNKRTIPTSMNRQNMNVYAILPNGVFLYQAVTHELIQISKTDVRSLFVTQDYMKTVPLILVYTGSDKTNSPLHAGSAYQNVGLYAVSAGLNSVVRMPREKVKIAQALDLPAEEFVIVTQAIGYPPKN